MQSNVDISRASLDKFGIQPYSEIIEPMLKKHSVEGSILFFEFEHLANQLKCRLAFSSLDGKKELKDTKRLILLECMKR